MRRGSIRLARWIAETRRYRYRRRSVQAMAGLPGQRPDLAPPRPRAALSSLRPWPKLFRFHALNPKCALIVPTVGGNCPAPSSLALPCRDRLQRPLLVTLAPDKR